MEELGPCSDRDGNISILYKDNGKYYRPNPIPQPAPAGKVFGLEFNTIHELNEYLSNFPTVNVITITPISGYLGSSIKSYISYMLNVGQSINQQISGGRFSRTNDINRYLEEHPDLHVISITPYTMYGTGDVLARYAFFAR